MGLVLIFIGGLMISTLIGNGMGLIWHDQVLAWTEPVASQLHDFSVGYLKQLQSSLFYVMWWVHLLILLTFLVYIPQSKHFHLIAGPVNVYFNRLDRMAHLRPIDFEALKKLKMKKKCRHLVLVKFKILHKSK